MTDRPGILIQARMGSNRFPGKVLQELNGKSILGFLLERLSHLGNEFETVVCTTFKALDDPIVEEAKGRGLLVVRGSEEDVLGRMVKAVLLRRFGAIVRLPADNPLIDPELISRMYQHFVEGDYDYIANFPDCGFPAGYLTEVVKSSVLLESFALADKGYQHEHVLPYVYEKAGRYRCSRYKRSEESVGIRLSLDSKEDLGVIRQTVRLCEEEGLELKLENIEHLASRNPEVFLVNRNQSQTTLEEVQSEVV